MMPIPFSSFVIRTDKSAESEKFLVVTQSYNVKSMADISVLLYGSFVW